MCAHSGIFTLALVAATNSTGCQLIGYDGVRPRDDAGDLRAVETDASGVTELHDAGGGADAKLTPDGGTSTLPDARKDSAAPCSGVINACGACSVLANALGASCGLCGLGRYACDGAKGLVCSGAAPTPMASGGPVLIDDFEDGDSTPKASSGADGYWTVYSDHTAGTLNPPDGSRITPAKEGAAGTSRSAHISGGGFTKFGAGLILFPNVQQCAFDASAEQGLGFWIKGSATVEVAVATTETVNSAFCFTASKCNDFYRTTYPLTTTWTYYMLPWSKLKQAGWGTLVPFVPSHVEYFQFSFGANVNFELYVDEFSFY